MMFHQEKIVFAIACVLSLGLSLYYFSVSTIFLENPPMQDATLGQADYSIHWEKPVSGSWQVKRSLFRPISEKKKVPPPTLELPKIEINAVLWIPPIPRPASMYWHQYPLHRIDPLPPDLALNLPQLTELSAQEPLSILANDIKANMRDQDLLILADGSQYQGKIISEAGNEIMLATTKGLNAQNLTFPKDRILRIHRRISLTEILQNRLSKVQHDPQQWATLLEAGAELELDDLVKPSYAQLLEKFPKSAEAYHSYARYLASRLDWEGACQVYLNTQQKGISSDALKLSEAELFARLGLPQRAIAILSTIAKPNAWIRGLEIAGSISDWNQVGEFLDRLQKLSERQAKPIQDIIVEWQARLALYRGEIEECLTICQKANKPLSSKILNIQGACLYLQGKLPQACLALQQAAKDQEIWAFYNLALVYANGGAWDSAIEILNKLLAHPAIVAEPSIVKATLGYCTYQKSPELFPLANTLFEDALKCNPQNPLAWYLWAEILKDKQLSQAVNAYQKALDLDFAFTNPLFRLATLTLENSDSTYYLEEAKARNLNELQSAETELNFAVHYILQEKWDQAQRSLQEALRIANQHLPILKLAAWQHNREDNAKLALNYLDRALSQAPNDEYCLATRQKIIENQNLVIWEDSFSRSDGLLRRRWQTIEQDGIHIFLRNQQAVMSGTNFKGNLLSGFIRHLPTENFVKIQLYLHSSSPTAYVGLFYGIWDKEGDKEGIYFGKGKDQSIVYTTSKSKKKEPWQTLGPWPDKPVAIAIARSRTEADTYLLLLNDQVVSKLNFKLSQEKQMQAGTFGFASQNQTWECTWDNAQIWEAQ